MYSIVIGAGDIGGPLIGIATRSGNEVVVVERDADITGPEMPAVTKGMLLLNMWVGRLEIIPITVLLDSIFRRLNLYKT